MWIRAASAGLQKSLGGCRLSQIWKNPWIYQTYPVRNEFWLCGWMKTCLFLFLFLFLSFLHSASPILVFCCFKCKFYFILLDVQCITPWVYSAASSLFNEPSPGAAIFILDGQPNPNLHCQASWSATYPGWSWSLLQHNPG